MIERLLGISRDAKLTAWEFLFRTDWPLALLIGLVLAAVAAAVLLYRRESALGKPSRAVLAAARALVLGLLLVVLFAPVLQARLVARVRPSVLVLLDGSQSMDIQDTRKDTASLAEAAMALGRVPFDAPELPRAVQTAAQAMQASALALESGNVEKAHQALDRVQHELQEVQALLSRGSPAPPQDVATGLGVIAARQATLKRDLDARGAEGALPPASVQRDLAWELEQWKLRALNAGLDLGEKLKTELALVSRRELAQAAVERSGRPVFEALARDADVRYFRFARQLEPVTGAADAGAGPADLGSDATYLGSAVERAVDLAGGQPVAAVVVLSDGASNGGADPVAAARKLAERGIPLVTVGVGLSHPDDALLRNLVVPDVVFANDLTPVRVECAASGYERRSTMLTVTLDGAEVARKTVTFTGQAQFEEVLVRASRSGGAKMLELTLAPLPGEATTENNTIRRPVKVLDEKIRVLYIEGTPRWEYRYVRAVLKRDPRIDVQFIITEGDKDLARASREHLGRFPEREGQAFQYDLVILGDVRAGVFTPTQLTLLEQLVRERGGSLIMIAGPKHAPAEYLDTPLAAMLPVRFEEGKWEEVGDDVHPVLTPAGRQGSVMALEKSEARTQALWANVKPLFQVAPLLGAKPGAQVLAELSDTAQRTRGYPLIAWQRYGTGKVMYVGTDQIWRLRARTGDKYHLKFWGQAIQFLTLSRLLGENKLVRLETDRGEAPVGDAVGIHASVLNELYEPSAAPGFTVYVQDPAGQVQPLALKALPRLAGMYHGLVTPREPGAYRVSSAAEDSPDTVSTAFRATAATTEQIETAMQRDRLVKMAQLTGGQYLALRDLPLLPEVIRPQPAAATVVRQVELWDNWLAPVLIVGLVAFEWAWRRKENLP